PAQVPWRALDVDRDAERLARLSPIHSVASQPHPVGGHNSVAVDECAGVFLIAKPAASLARPAGVPSQSEVLDRERKTGLGELGGLVAGVWDDVNGIVAVGIVPTTGAAAEDLTGEERLAVEIATEEAGISDGFLIGRHAAFDRLR